MEKKENMSAKIRTYGRSKLWSIIVTLVLFALIGAVVGVFIKLDRQTTTERLGAEAYSIGAIDEKGEFKESELSIYTRKGVTVKGLTCELGEKAKIKYQLYYFDKDGKFVSASEVLTANFTGTGVPESAETAKIVITPTADEDGKVTITEVFGYAAQLTVQYNR